jgi:hypothetical protein
MTDYTKSQLAQILSAIDGQPRNPNNRATARRILESRAIALKLTLDDIFTAADGLLDGRMSPEDFRATLLAHDQVVLDMLADSEPEAEPEGTIAPHEMLEINRPDEVAECWDGVSDALYSKLWAVMRSVPAWTGETPPEPDVNAVSQFWHLLDDDAKRALNALAERRQAEIDAHFAPAEETPAEEPRLRQPREGTKQATMIAMLKRPEGASVAQIAMATGWQHHTIRGAMAHALKKKLGLTITTEKVRQVGPNNTGAAGSYTIYRIV